MDLIIKKNKIAHGWCQSLFDISEIKHVTKNLTTDITITSKVFMNKPKEKYTVISLLTRALIFRRWFIIMVMVGQV